MQQQTISPHSVNNPLESMQDGETIIADINRHPVGLIMTHVGAGLFILLLVGMLLFADRALGLDRDIVWGGWLGVILLSLLTVIYMYIATKVYYGNRWIVTSDSVTQMSQTSLFHNQASQLSLGNLEDITAEQNGIMTHLFGYGTLRTQSAGEHSKFVLDFCPNPTYYAQLILDAREKFLALHPGE